MAKIDFEQLFDDLLKMSPTDYKKEWLKDNKATRKNAEFGLVLTKFSLGGKTAAGLFLHFRKMFDMNAAVAFLNEKTSDKYKKSGNKIYLLAVKVVNADGVEDFQLSKFKGKYEPKKIYESLKYLFPEGGKRSLSIDGYEENGKTPSNSNATPEKEEKEPVATEKEPEETEKEEKKEVEEVVDEAKRKKIKAVLLENYTTQEKKFKKIKDVKGSLSRKKINDNVALVEGSLEKLKTAVSKKLGTEAEIEENIAALEKELKELKKLSKAERDDIGKKMVEIEAELKQITDDIEKVFADLA